MNKLPDFYTRNINTITEEEKIELEKLKIIVRKVGEQIESANELDVNLVNAIADKIPEWIEISEGSGEEFLNYGTIYDNVVWLNDKNICTFTLKDNSRWRYIRNTYKCILHPFNQYEYTDEAVFQCLDDEKLFKCADCNKFLKNKDEIIREYHTLEYNILFPSEWTDEGIISWCEKRESKQEEYNEKRQSRWLARQEKERLFADCSSCIHMKHGECEYCNDTDNESSCDDYEKR